MATVFDVAKYILESAPSGCMTTWKLQKLVYYSQAWSLVWDERPLFEAQIQAWANGPVVPLLYGAHKGKFSICADEIEGNSDSLSPDEKETIDAVMEFYGDKSGSYLSALTHMERPWKEARGDLPPGEQSKAEIPLDLMAEYYGSIAAAESETSRQETPEN